MTAPILLPNLDAPDATPSRHELARFLAGELTPERRAHIESLIATDARVKAILDELKAEDAAFRVDVPLERFLSDHEKKTESPLVAFMSRFRLGAIGALAVGAAAVFFLVRDPGEYDGIKGGGRIGFLVKEGDSAKHGVEGEQLKQGDRIQFIVKDDSHKSAMVLVGVDGKGQVTVYAADAVDRIKGEEKARPLDVSVVLDDAKGPERFFVVYADGDIDALKREVESAAQKLVEQKADLVETEQLPLDKRHVQSSVHIVKVDR
jgi:hypothetical protein